MMRIGLVLGSGGGGIERYTSELALALATRPEVDVVPIGTREKLDRLVSFGGPAMLRHGKIVLGAQRQVLEALEVRYQLGLNLRAADLDVLHCTKHLIPAGATVPTVLTVYDLLVIDRPGDFPLAKRVLLPKWYMRSLRHADALLPISSAVAEHVSARIPDVVGKLYPVPLAASSSVLDGQAVPLAPLAGRKFAVVVGDLSPRKNLQFLAKIWPNVFRETGLLLAVAGSGGFANAETETILEGLAQDGMAQRLGRVSDAELRWLYDNAAVCCVPSLEEGFGLPVAEALARGCPVVANTDPALMEAGVGRAVYVSVHDEAAWARALSLVATRTRSQVLRESIRTWDAVAGETIACYRRVAEIRQLRSPRLAA